VIEVIYCVQPKNNIEAWLRKGSICFF